jgi:hypothetical protein
MQCRPTDKAVEQIAVASHEPLATYEGLRVGDGGHEGPVVDMNYFLIVKHNGVSLTLRSEDLIICRYIAGIYTAAVEYISPKEEDPRSPDRPGWSVVQGGRL